MGTSETAEYRIGRTDGEYHWHVGRGLSVRDFGDQIVKWIGTTTDDTTTR